VRADVQIALDCGLELVNGLLLVRLRGPQPGQVLPCTGFNEKGIAATSSPTASHRGLESRLPGAACGRRSVLPGSAPLPRPGLRRGARERLPA